MATTISAIHGTRRPAARQQLDDCQLACNDAKPVSSLPDPRLSEPRTAHARSPGTNPGFRFGRAHQRCAGTSMDLQADALRAGRTAAGAHAWSKQARAAQRQSQLTLEPPNGFRGRMAVDPKMFGDRPERPTTMRVSSTRRRRRRRRERPLHRRSAVNGPSQSRLRRPLPEPANRLLDGVVVDAEVKANRLHVDARSAHPRGLSGDTAVQGQPSDHNKGHVERRSGNSANGFPAGSARCRAPCRSRSTPR